MKTKLTKSGYTILKSEYTPKKIKEIKDELFVKPYTFNKNANCSDSKFIWKALKNFIYLVFMD